MGSYRKLNFEIDHKELCGSLRSFEDMPDFARRMFVNESKLQRLCKECHKEKTRQENIARKKASE